MNYLSLFLCVKYLCRKKIVLLSIAAVAMSCALLIVVASLFTGFINAIENGASNTLGDVVLSDIKFERFDEFIADLESNPAIDSATAVLNGQGLLLVGKGNVRAVQVWGIQMPKRSDVVPFAGSLLAGSKSFNESNDTLNGFVSIGVLANPDEKTDEYDFDAAVEEFIGKKVRLTTGTSADKKPRSIKFNVSDVVFSGIYFYDRGHIYLPIEGLSKQLYPDQAPMADMVHIKIDAGIDIEIAIPIIRGIWMDFAMNKLGLSQFAARSVSIYSSKKLQARSVSEYRKQMNVLMVIFGLISGGIILLIFCVFYLITMTRQKDIAVVKSCGMGSAAVVLLFVAFGLITGIAGSGLGVLLGYFITENINPIENWISQIMGMKMWSSSTYMFNVIPSQVAWSSLTWIVMSAIIACGIGSLVPAFLTVRLKPVEVLRYE